MTTTTAADRTTLSDRMRLRTYRDAALGLLVSGRKALPSLPGLVRRLWKEERRWLWVILPMLVIAWPALHWAVSCWTAFDNALLLQPLTVFVALFLVYQSRFVLRQAHDQVAFLYPVGSSRRQGKPWPILLGCVLAVIATLTVLPTLGLLSLLVILVGILYYLYGPFILRMLWQPLALLIVVAPPPLGIMSRLTIVLSQGTTLLAGQLLHLMVPGTIGRFGVLILPHYRFEVGGVISGLNVVLPAMLLTLWYCAIRWIRIDVGSLLIVAAAAFGALLNVLRVALIGLIGEYSGNTADVLVSPFVAHVGSFFLVILATAGALYLLPLVAWIRRSRVSQFEADLRAAAAAQAAAPPVLRPPAAAAAPVMPAAAAEPTKKPAAAAEDTAQTPPPAAAAAAAPETEAQP